MTKQVKRNEIVRATLELIVEHGFHGASMAMIADRAGVGAGTIYRYFDNKDVLITELYREVEEKLISILVEGYPGEKPFRERFHHLGEGLLHHFIGNPLEFRYLEQFHNSPFGVAVRRDKILGKRGGHDIFRIFFEEGVDGRVIKDLPLAVLFSLAFGPLIAVARDHILGFIILDDSLVARTVEACWHAIREEGTEPAAADAPAAEKTKGKTAINNG